MKGCRPLTNSEVELILNNFTGPYALRDKALFVTGLKTGLRIQELLSLRISDVIQNDAMLNCVYVERKNIKRKAEGRNIPLHDSAKKALLEWIKHMGSVPIDTYIFQSERGVNQNKPIGKVHAWRILKAAFAVCKISGKTGTHSMRKTFAAKAYALEKDIRKTQVALGHKDLESTASYLSVSDEDIEKYFLSA